MKRLTLALIAALWSQSAFGHSLGVFANALGTDCNLVIPYPGGSVAAYVVGTIDGTATLGVEVASFRIGGLPEGWTWSVSAIAPGAMLAIGNPFVEGVTVAYFNCVAGRQILLTLSITPSTAVENISLVLLPHTNPGTGCGFEGQVCGQPCPRFCGCNGFGTDCLCVEPLPATINGAPCTVGIQNWTWGQVKATYK